MIYPKSQILKMLSHLSNDIFVAIRRRIKSIIACLLISLGLALITNQFIWGYLLYRPSIINRLPPNSEILAIGFFPPEISDEFLESTLHRTETLCSKQECKCNHSILAPFCQSQDSYYCLNECLLSESPQEFETMRRYSTVEPDIVRASLIQLGLPTDRLQRTSDWMKCWSSVFAIKISTIQGQKLLLGITGCTKYTDDDRRWYHQALVSLESNNRPTRIDDRTEYFYEVSGLEGLDWPHFFIFYSIIFFGLFITREVTLN